MLTYYDICFIIMSKWGGNMSITMDKDEISRCYLQTNLELIRKAGGWSAETFGNMIGVQKQTIRNIEMGTTSLSKTQYIAIMAVLDAEIAKRNDPDDMLSVVLGLIYGEEELTQENRQKAMIFINGVVSNKKTAPDKKTSKAWLLGILGATSVVVITAGKLLAKALNK